MKPAIATLLFAMLFSSSLAAEPIDDLLRSIDTIPTKAELERIEDVEGKLKSVLDDASRSLYERSRALSFLMYWGHRELLCKQTEPALIKIALFGLAKYHPNDLSKQERELFVSALAHPDHSVGVVALRATSLLKPTFAERVLKLGQKSKVKVVAKVANREIAKRFVEVK